MLAERNCCFSSAEFFHAAFSASANQASRCALTPIWSLRSTLLATNALSVDLAMTRTHEEYHAPILGATIVSKANGLKSFTGLQQAGFANARCRLPCGGVD